MLVSVGTLYFTYVFFEKKDVAFRYKLFFGTLLGVFLVLIPTQLNIPGFDLLNCEAEQGPMIYYFYFLELLFFVWLIVYLLIKVIFAKAENRKITILFSIGVICFLASFSGANVVGSITEHWEILQYGLFGMPIFMAFLVYFIVQYKLFNIKLLLVQALVIIMVVITASQFFYIQNSANRILTSITLVLMLIFGWWLVRSVKREVSQREELAHLAHSLEKANVRLKELDQQKTEFLSIASHQLRTPLSIIKGYIELIEDGAYGKTTKKMLQTLRDMDESNERLVKLVDEFLDITRIEQGRTKFVFANSPINELITGVVKELSERAVKNGLRIVWKPNTDIGNAYMDEEKVRHVIFNFVDNAIKYTPKGTVEILVEHEDNGVTVRVKDQGIGFGKEDEANFFQKFYRGENVKGSNVNGTGLGIYVCRKFIEAHEGHVWAHSAGIGKGSEFGFWIPSRKDG